MRRVLIGGLCLFLLAAFVFDFNRRAGVEHPWLWTLGISGGVFAVWGIGELITNWFARPGPLEDKN
jgi:hypothetical protein